MNKKITTFRGNLTFHLSNNKALYSLNSYKSISLCVQIEYLEMASGCLCSERKIMYIELLLLWLLFFIDTILFLYVYIKKAYIHIYIIIGWKRHLEDLISKHPLLFLLYPYFIYGIKVQCFLGLSQIYPDFKSCRLSIRLLFQCIIIIMIIWLFIHWNIFINSCSLSIEGNPNNKISTTWRE